MSIVDKDGRRTRYFVLSPAVHGERQADQRFGPLRRVTWPPLKGYFPETHFSPATAEGVPKGGENQESFRDDQAYRLLPASVFDTITAMNNPLRTSWPRALVFVSSILSIIVAVGSSTVLAQTATKRLVHVTVTEPLGRFVGGVERRNFGIVENGVGRPITDFTELRNEYLIEFETANPSAGVEVVLQQPRGLPPLRANLK
jgi:hypothetical protein